MKPKVFVNSINKEICNNKESYHYTSDLSKNNINLETDMIDISDSFVIRSKINEIFSSSSFVYKSRVEILLKDKTKIFTDVIAVKDNNLITLDNKKISIDDILEIKKAN